jgi:hypothetical protein
MFQWLGLVRPVSQQSHRGQNWLPHEVLGDWMALRTMRFAVCYAERNSARRRFVYVG